MSCSDCFKGFLHNGTPVGTEETLHGMRTYIAGPPGAHTSPSTVIFITDAFGFNLVNSKLLADRYAAETGFRVLVPDIIPGGGVPLHSLALTNAITTPAQWWNIPGHLARIAAVMRAMTIFIPFAMRTRGVFPATLEYARAVRAALPQGAKLGAVGFCWGGMQTTKLSAEPAAIDGDKPLLDAHFTAHPSGLKVPDDFIEATKKFKVPFSMAVGDNDMILSTAAVADIEAGVREAFGEVAAERCLVQVYPSCGHGFSVRADPKMTVENEAAGQAAQQAVEWFKKWLVET